MKIRVILSVELLFSSSLLNNSFVRLLNKREGDEVSRHSKAGDQKDETPTRQGGVLCIARYAEIPKGIVCIRMGMGCAGGVCIGWINPWSRRYSNRFNDNDI